jgi:hypothetical protein
MDVYLIIRADMEINNKPINDLANYIKSIRWEIIFDF